MFTQSLFRKKRDLNKFLIQAPPLQLPSQKRMSFTQQDVALIAMPMTLPPPIEGTAKLPQFGFLYQEFERMKVRFFVVRMLKVGLMKTAQPATAVSSVPLVTKTVPTFINVVPVQPERNERDCFVAAMKLFMKSYMPTACFDCAEPVDDWSKEAGALISEITSAATADRCTKNTWPTKSRSPSIDSCVDSAPNSIVEDIHRHLLDIKPSPYPSGVPASVNSSDNEDDDGRSIEKRRVFISYTFMVTAYKTVNGGSIGPRNLSSVVVNTTVHQHLSNTIFFSPLQHSSYNQDNVCKIRLSMDSGYQSSSTDGGSSVSSKYLAVHGSQVTRELYDDAASEISSSSSTSQPCSPTRRGFCGDFELNSVSPRSLQTYLSALQQLPFQNNNNLPAKRTVSGDSDLTTEPYQNQKHKEWITEEILEMIAVRDRLYKRMKKQPSPDMVEMYKKVRNMVVGLTRNAKRAHEKKIEDATKFGGYPTTTPPSFGVTARYR
ncbi:uncharacterized protein LOC100183225 [Ciona intestinalis]